MAQREGLKAVLMSCPAPLNKVLLLSRIGAQAGKGGISMRSFFGLSTAGTFAGLEDVLTSATRRRSGNQPLQALVVRVGAPSSDEVAEAGAGAARCLPGDEDDSGSTTARATAAEALLQALLQDVNTNFCVVGGPGAAGAVSLPPLPWQEMLLPYVGPELWRTEVRDSRRAAIFAQQWANEWFGSVEGKDSMRFGLKTPVQLQKTPTGVIFKFRPLGTLPGREFQDLQDGGVELVAEEPSHGGKPRLRAKRCAYGFKTVVKENSERALIQKFKDDWYAAGL